MAAVAEGDVQERRAKGGGGAHPAANIPFLDTPSEPAGPAAKPAVASGSPDRQRHAAPPRQGLSWVRLTALLFIGLPTLLTALYYVLWAADQYVVEVRFAVRGPSGAANVDVLGIVTGTATSGSTTTDSYIVMDFIKSRQIIEQLEGHLDLKKVYNHARADWPARLGSSKSREDELDYWKWMVTLSFDTTSQVIAVRTKAFTPEDARAVATAVIKLSENLVNDLSVRARTDSVKYAQQELARMEERLKLNRVAQRAFREKQQEFDPRRAADAQLALLSKLTDELSAQRTRMTTLRQNMGENAPPVQYLATQIKALEQQIEVERQKFAAAAVEQRDPALSQLVADFDELAVEREFAEKAYVSALASLERARADADRQQRYLATFVSPSLPQDALYPKRILNTIGVFAGTAILWALGMLIFYGVRDHAV